MELERYKQKRDFVHTPEPEGNVTKSLTGRLYVIQKHAASRLHYDLRLELNGVLKSWAIPKGPSLDPAEKRLAVHVEDHPIQYGSFEGIIPQDEYGGGTVMLWDRGEWEPLGDPDEAYQKGDLKFRLFGEKLKGTWVLARMKGRSAEDGKNWLLIKKRDEASVTKEQKDPLQDKDRSVLTGRNMGEIASGTDDAWYEDESVPLKDVPAEDTGLKSKTKNKDARIHGKIKIDASALPGARPAPMPEFFHPELAALVSKPPDGENWIHEIKYDGYRILCFLAPPAGRSPRLISRNGKDWTERFSEIALAANKFGVDNAILDGEIVVVDPSGRTDFQALQNVLQGVQSGRLVYYVFDIPYCQGFDITRSPLLERKKLLRSLLETDFSGDSQILYTDHIQGQGDDVFTHACRFALEGMVSKLADSPYEQKRSRRWVKVKCIHRQEFVIGGFTDPGGSRAAFGALLLGFYDPERNFVYSGRVGTGFKDKTLKSLFTRLDPLRIDKPGFVNPPTVSEAGGAHWVRPELVCEVEFTSWTEDGVLRHPSFKGIRDDKDASDVVRDDAGPQITEYGKTAYDRLDTESGPARAPATNLKRRSTKPATVIHLSNPDRLLYPEIGISKRALAEYYADIAQWILPHLKKRPLTLVRCPEGWEKECFYQKHLGDKVPDALRSIPIEEKNGNEYYSVLDNAAGLTALVQIGVLEIHVWGSREDKLEKPDMMVFDLDPDPAVPWTGMIDAALCMRDELSALGLKSFLKTTGGKGLHVVVPLTPLVEWDLVKDFSRAVAENVVRQFPADYIATMSKQKRRSKIFIDYLRNGRGATSVSAYSTRARRGAPISTPLAWDELSPDIRPDTFNIQNIRQRLSSRKSDPWEGYFSVRQSITAKMRTQVLPARTKPA
jgi:bifunctional non-homologous end joining protein LigD